MNPSRAPRPDWLKVRAPSGKRVEEVSGMLPDSVCGRCVGRPSVPTLGSAGGGAATVILLGDVCTRGCAFCSVTAGCPLRPIPPSLRLWRTRRRNLLAARGRHLRHARRPPRRRGGPLRSVVRALRREAPGATVELLVPDFAGNVDALRCVVDADPDILAHNVETVPRLYPVVRKGCQLRPVRRPHPSRRRDASLPVAEIRDHGRVRGRPKGK